MGRSLRDDAWPDGFRRLVNPVRRTEIPPGFPGYCRPGDAPTLLTPSSLARQGIALDHLDSVTLAYPRKHPKKFPKYHDHAVETVREVQAVLARDVPEIACFVADGLVENIPLDRTSNQNSVHTLAARQSYSFVPESQTSPLPFLDPGHTEKDYFTIIDHVTEQGTTVANLASFIRANGGVPIGIVSNGSGTVVQRMGAAGPCELSGGFVEAARNNRRARELATVFARSARDRGLDWSPQDCLEKFEAGLNRRGNTLYALTDVECRRLRRTITGEGRRPALPFPDFLEDPGAYPGKVLRPDDAYSAKPSPR